MRIWAIADLHLSFGVANKKMDVFGPHWANHAEQVARHWKELIAPEDLVLLAGDFSWAMTIQEVLPDLAWLEALPGIKVMIKGNHDFWWGSLKKVVTALPPSIHVIQNNAFLWKDIAVGGTRLWDTPEYSFGSHIEVQGGKDLEKAIQQDLTDNIFNRELERLKLSLKALDSRAKLRLAMTHYPPIGPKMEPSRTAQILEEHRIDVCVFGHLHNVRKGSGLFGERNGVRYVLTACDFLEFKPILIWQSA